MKPQQAPMTYGLTPNRQSSSLPLRAKLLIADDHRIVLEGLSSILSNHPDFEVCATCSDGTTALRLIQELRPTIALLDWVMPGLDGIEVLSQVRAEFLKTHVVLLTGLASQAQLVRAFAHGANGMIAKEDAVASLVACLQSVAAGHR